MFLKGAYKVLKIEITVKAYSAEILPTIIVNMAKVELIIIIGVKYKENIANTPQINFFFIKESSLFLY